MIQLLIVEDQLAVRKGLHMRLAVEAGLSIIGEVTDFEATSDLPRSLFPDVSLIDADMPHADGIAMVSKFHSTYSQSAIIVLSHHDDKIIRARAIEAGAAAFVVKSLPPDALLAAIHEVADSQLQ